MKVLKMIVAAWLCLRFVRLSITGFSGDMKFLIKVFGIKTKKGEDFLINLYIMYMIACLTPLFLFLD